MESFREPRCVTHPLLPDSLYSYSQKITLNTRGEHTDE